jgi:thiol-disulfide isomerase/thioredoxin
VVTKAHNAAVMSACPPRPANRRQVLAGLGAAGAAALLPAGGRARAQGAGSPPLPAVGSVLAPPPALSLLDGSPFAPDSVRGQLLVLYWWASWCPFCAVVSPEIDKLWRAQRGRGLRVLGLSVDRKPEDASGYLSRRGYIFPSAWVSPDLGQAQGRPDAAGHRHLRRAGHAIENGFRLHVAEQGGKLGGREIEFFKVDDESDPSKATDNVNKLIKRDNVDVLVGTVHSAWRWPWPRWPRTAARC